MLRRVLRRGPAASRCEELEIPLGSCVHYTGFRYGRGEFNPLERSAIDLHTGVSLLEARRAFVEFLLYYRPRNLGQALGIELSRPCPLWAYPWWALNEAQLSPTHAWCEDPEDVRDIITHFSEAGILSYRIDQEFFWQERALRAIARNGYDPRRHSHVRALELRPGNGPSAYILMDGNHRVSALSALGQASLAVHRDTAHIIREDALDDWPGVRDGRVPREDALAIFKAYFTGNHRPRTTATPAPVIAPPDWKALYLPATGARPQRSAESFSAST